MKSKTVKLFAAISIISLFSVQSVNAQSHIFTVNSRMEYSAFVQGERIFLELGVQNNGSIPYIIDDYGSYTNNSISVYLRNNSGKLLTTNKSGSDVKDVMIMPEESETFDIDLCDLFDIGEGRYQVTVVIRRGDIQVATRAISFSVVRGLEIGSKTRVKEGNDSIAYKYTLLYWARKDREYIFLRITEVPSGKLYGFAQLGTVIRAVTPTITFLPGNIVEITHQTTRDGFIRTKLDASAKQLRLVSREELISSDSIAEALATRQAHDKIKNDSTEKQQKKGFLRKNRTQQ